MAGPIIEAVKERVAGEETTGPVRERIRESPIFEEHQEALQEEMGSGGGCCNATMAARAVRSEKQEYR